jgi:hypothetical protein
LTSRCGKLAFYSKLQNTFKSKNNIESFLLLENKEFSFLGVSPMCTMDAARIPREATRDLSAVYSIFGLDLPSFVRRVRGKTCMLTINRLKVNNSTQLNFTSPTGKLGKQGALQT